MIWSYLSQLKLNINLQKRRANEERKESEMSSKAAAKRQRMLLRAGLLRTVGNVRLSALPTSPLRAVNSLLYDFAISA